MNRRALCIGVGLLAAGVPVLAETFEDSGLKIKIEAPEGFKKVNQTPNLPEVLGECKGVYNHPNPDATAGQMFIHYMTLPDGATFADFKNSLNARLDDHFGGGYKLVKQEDVNIAGREGMLIEFQSPGTGTFPEPAGTIPHHTRWLLLKDGDGRAIGVVLHSREAAWKDLEPKFTAAQKSIKGV